MDARYTQGSGTQPIRNSARRPVSDPVIMRYLVPPQLVDTDAKRQPVSMADGHEPILGSGVSVQSPQRANAFGASVGPCGHDGGSACHQCGG